MGLPVACGTRCVHMWKHVFHSCVCMYACMGTYSGPLLDSPRATALLQLHRPLRERTWQDAATDVGARAWPGPREPSVVQVQYAPAPHQSHGNTVPAWHELSAAGMGLCLYKRVVY